LDDDDAENPHLKKQADEEVRHRHRRAKERHNLKVRLTVVTDKARAKLPDGAVYVDPAVDTPDLDQRLRRAGRHRGCRDTACLFIVSDVTNPDQRCHWNAVLKGGCLVTPRAFECDDACNGPIICFKAASGTRRTIHMTVKFKEKHSEVARLLTSVQTWNFIEVREDYVARYRRCKQNHASMALLKRKSETMELKKHVYDADEFLHFLRKVVQGESRMGICKR
jgi:hypothetical protein